MSVSVLIVDDEPLSCLGVSARLSKHRDMKVVGECHDGEAALRAVRQFSPDVMFLDIEMPGLSGLDLLRALPPNTVPCVVFLTAHQIHAVEAFSVEATDFLLKPVHNGRFEACLDRVRRSLLSRQSQAATAASLLPDANLSGTEWLRRITVKRGKNVTVVTTDEVEWIEGQCDYASLHVGGRTHLVRTTLTSLVKRLDPKHFLRVHRSAIIQVSFIKRVEALTNRDAFLTLRSGKQLRVSRSYSQELQKLLRNQQ